MLIPAGTEVSSTQTETEKPIVFSTDRELKIQPPQLSKIYSRISGGEEGKKAFKEQNIRRLEAGFEGFEVFTSVPQVDDALYFGFENNISQHILGFEMDWDPAGGAGIDPTLPPYLWEASTGAEGERWAHCEVEMDQSKGLNVAGRIQIHLPQMGKYDVKGNSLYWVRLRVIPLTPEMEREGARPYRLSPRLRKAVAASWGGTVAATHSQTITREFLGQSNGSPGQRFQLKYIPILDRLAQETLVVQVDGEAPQPWKEVSDFSDSWAHDPHFTLDSTSGEVRLGPAVRQPDGTIKMYGDVPARGANLIFESYRYGGGQEGNVQPGILNTLKTAIPFIGRVRNRFPASGGMDSESLEAAMMRAPALLRSRQRAVTEADYEFLARQALPSAIGRVKCLQPSPSEAGKILPGQVFVLVIPRLNQPEGFLDPELLKLEDKHIKALSAYLNERRLLTCRLDIRPPAYQWVAVKVRLRPSPGADPGKVKQDVLSRLYHYLNPLTGGPDGKGWPLGAKSFLPIFTNAYKAFRMSNLFVPWKCSVPNPALKPKEARWKR